MPPPRHMSKLYVSEATGQDPSLTCFHGWDFATEPR
jgi:hypothetical protein